MSKINILGTEYTLTKDSELYDMDGCCDKTTKEIKVCKTLSEKNNHPNAVGKIDWFERKVTRHELIHALAFESGLHESSFMHNEALVDWIAVMYPKMKEIFKTLDIEE